MSDSLHFCLQFCKLSCTCKFVSSLSCLINKLNKHVCACISWLVFPSQNRRPVVYLPTKEDGTTEQGKGVRKL